MLCCAVLRCAVRMVTCRYYCFGFGWSAFDWFGPEPLRDCCDRLRYAEQQKSWRMNGELPLRTYAVRCKSECMLQHVLGTAALVGRCLVWHAVLFSAGSTSSSGHCSATALLALSTCAGKPGGRKPSLPTRTVGGAPATRNVGSMCTACRTTHSAAAPR